MRWYRCLLLLLFQLSEVCAQEVQYVYRSKQDSSVNCYLKIVPRTGPIRGIIVRDYSELPDTAERSPFRLKDLAVGNGMLMLYTVTSTLQPQFYHNDSCVLLLDDIIAEVIKAHRVPKENIFIGGMSASGTRALRYAQFCAQGKSRHGHRVKGVFAADPPLDLERFYQSATRHIGNFKAAMHDEAEMMSRLFPQMLGGPPSDFPERYVQASVFSHTDPAGGNAALLKDMHLILFHEPDIDWWITARGSSYEDINSYDIAGFVVKLRSLGSTKVDLVTTTGKGFDRKGQRNCHSWTIVDEDHLMKWIVDRIE